LISEAMLLVLVQVLLGIGAAIKDFWQCRWMSTWSFWIGRLQVSDKRGATLENLPPIFTRMKVRPEAWCELASDFGRLFGVVAGQPHRIDEHRSRRKQRRYRVGRRTRELFASV